MKYRVYYKTTKMDGHDNTGVVYVERTLFRYAADIEEVCWLLQNMKYPTAVTVVPVP